jgi:hydroxyethylthiazole kinase-like uncharacterized protein yjeF
LRFRDCAAEHAAYWSIAQRLIVASMTRHPAFSSPCPVLAATEPWPLFDAAQTRRIESRLLARCAPHALMARAGLGVARLALALAPHAQRIGVMAGPGNNGGDGLIAALHLTRRGRQVQVLHLADAQRLPADAADARRQLQDAGVPVVHDIDALDDAELLIDALLGLGASRAPAGAIANAIEWTADRTVPILAVDLPSGLNPDNGSLLGASAIRAHSTLSLLTLKPGLFTAQGRDHAGAVWFDALDQADGEAPAAWLGSASAPPHNGFEPRRHAQHKGSFGDLFVVGGAAGMQGAAWLAAGAALKAGAGRVYLSPLAPTTPAPARPELMLREQVWLAEAGALDAATVVCGCGGGSAVETVLKSLLDHAGRLLLDADALNAVARDASLQAALAARTGRGQATVLTPHPLEAARLAGCTVAAVQADRLRLATTLSRRFGAVVLLKGSGSVIAAPGQAPWINASGNAALATPGSGDVLAGWIGGLWAQRAGSLESAWTAARAAAWLHGHAADLHRSRHVRSGSLPLCASDLIDAMAAALG